MKKDWRLEVIDKAIEYYDGCRNVCVGICEYLLKYTPNYEVEYSSEQWYQKYIDLFQPALMSSRYIYFWPANTEEGVQCRQIAIRLIRAMVEEDIKKEKSC